jgi:hypothetical protein
MDTVQKHIYSDKCYGTTILRNEPNQFQILDLRIAVIFKTHHRIHLILPKSLNKI